MYGIDDRLRSTLNAKHSAVNAKAVACSCAPFLIGVVIVIACTALIRLGDHILGFLRSFIVFSCNTIDSPVQIRMDEHTEAVLADLQVHSPHSGRP